MECDVTILFLLLGKIDDDRNGNDDVCLFLCSKMDDGFLALLTSKGDGNGDDILVMVDATVASCSYLQRLSDNQSHNYKERQFRISNIILKGERMMMSSPRSLMFVLSTAATLSFGWVFVSVSALVPQHPPISSSLSPRTVPRAKHRRSPALAVSSQQIEETSTQGELPYVVTRGDGSTGGGGLPMPERFRDGAKESGRASVTPEEDGSADADGLRRPKVGAEMPHGRPSWFKVPAPSQGEILVFGVDSSQ